MNPYERRIIHSALQNNKFVDTHSEGEDPYRKVVITLKSGVDTGYEKKRYPYGNRRYYNGHNNGGYRKNSSYRKKYYNNDYEKKNYEKILL